MAGPEEFSFGDTKVAEAYDRGLVPLLFTPWARKLAADPSWDWEGRTVVDLATGTGIIAETLSSLLGPRGRILATDINSEMLDVARQRCAAFAQQIEFITSPASPLAVADGVADVVVCQQGFQFFPDRDAAAREMARVLRPGGRAYVSTWLPVERLAFFHCIVEVLTELGHGEIGELMRRPFDFMPTEDLAPHFAAAGFEDIQVTQEELDMEFPGGAEQVVSTSYCTPIGAKLAALPADTQEAFRTALRARYRAMESGTGCMGRSATNVVVATRGTA